MSSFLPTVAIGIVSFIATNIDDIILLALFFSQVGHGLRNRDVVVGQYLGFIAILVVSLLGLIAGVVLPHQWTSLLGLVPIALGVRAMWDWSTLPEETGPDSPVLKQAKPRRGNPLTPFVSTGSYQVAAITLANGGDNIGTYLPIFANRPPQVGTLLVVYLLLTGVWCYLGSRLVLWTPVATVLTRYGRYMTPLVFIAIGLAILWEGRAK